MNRTGIITPPPPPPSAGADENGIALDQAQLALLHRAILNTQPWLKHLWWMAECFAGLDLCILALPIHCREMGWKYSQSCFQHT